MRSLPRAAGSSLLGALLLLAACSDAPAAEAPAAASPAAVEAREGASEPTDDAASEDAETRDGGSESIRASVSDGGMADADASSTDAGMDGAVNTPEPDASTAPAPSRRGARRGTTPIQVPDCIRTCVRGSPLRDFSEAEARAECARTCRGPAR